MVSSQTKDQKWVLGVSGSLISFGDAGAASMIKERFNFQFPKLNLTRYLFKGFILEGGVTLSSIDRVDGLYTNAFNYISLDGAIRYDFNNRFDGYCVSSVNFLTDKEPFLVSVIRKGSLTYRRAQIFRVRREKDDRYSNIY